MVTLPIRLPRHALSPAQVARAGDVWRLAQDASVQASARTGWPPERFRREGSAFLLHQGVCVHHRPIRYGERLTARVWVSELRRGVLGRREMRIHGSAGLAGSITHQVLHVGLDLRVKRASRELETSLSPATGEAGPEFPVLTQTPAESPEYRFTVDVWYTWMDVLGHLGHPSYVDLCDEALARAAATRGISPDILEPIAERASWHRPAKAPSRLIVRTRFVGRSTNGWAFQHLIDDEAGVRVAEIATIRRARDDSNLTPLTT